MQTRKPSGKFPLWLHPTGQWCKKIKGTFHYFGKDQDAALKRYVKSKDDLAAGRKPRDEAGVASIADVANAFLTMKEQRVASGELSQALWSQYHVTCDKLIDHFGRSRSVTDLRPEDFAGLRAKVAVGVGPVTLLNFITKARVVFKFAFDFGMIDRPVLYGNAFERPSKGILRRQRAANGERLITAGDAWRLIGAADPQLRAMIFLGLNGGMGATDCSLLTRSMLTTRPGWLNYPRPKTSTPRRFPLWPETIAAVDAVADIRPDAKSPEHEDRVFLTRLGQPWVRFNGKEGKRTTMDAVACQFIKLAATTKVKATFYLLRHLHRTIADELPDRPAIDLIMGHSDHSMASHYREKISDERLAAVTSHIRKWLMAGKPEDK
jgi:integrase